MERSAGAVDADERAVSAGESVEGPSSKAVRWSAMTGTLLLVAALSALFFYKWGSSLRALRRVNETGALGISPDALLNGGVWRATLSYFGRIWPALAYGVIVGAVVRSSVPSTWVAALLGRRGAKSTLAGAAFGSPLMLCSCCVTPVFTGVYERGARLGPSLSLMLASPGLNVAALALTFLLMPLRFGIARLLAAFLIVFVLAPLIGKRLEGTVRPRAALDRGREPPTPRHFVIRFLRSLAYITLVTVPLVVAGVLLSALLLPHAAHLPAYGLLAILGVALVATLIALPTFFEIPIAFLLLQLGAPPGAAVALLIAGPIINLPSLFVLGRETSPRVAASVAAGVFAIACAAGLAASL